MHQEVVSVVETEEDLEVETGVVSEEVEVDTNRDHLNK